jgi:hypothetical protein
MKFDMFAFRRSLKWRLLDNGLSPALNTAMFCVIGAHCGSPNSLLSASETQLSILCLTISYTSYLQIIEIVQQTNGKSKPRLRLAFF